MRNLVLNAVAKRDTRRHQVRLFLSVSENSAPVSDLQPQSIHVESVEGTGPVEVTAVYPEAYAPGRYVAVLRAADLPSETPVGPYTFKVEVADDGEPGARTFVYLAPRGDESSNFGEIVPV